MIDNVNCVQPCMCCEFSDSFEINSKNFWLNIQRKGSSEGIRFLHEKSIYLDEFHGCVLVLGLNPKNGFKICMRIEMQATHEVLPMNAIEFSKFMEYICHHFITTSIFPETSMDMSNGMSVHLISSQSKMFKLRIGLQSLTITEEALYHLYIIRSHMKMCILMLEVKCKQYETQFFKLLIHFCSNRFH